MDKMVEILWKYSLILLLIERDIAKLHNNNFISISLLNIGRVFTIL